jgi:hypothetical protein
MSVSFDPKHIKFSKASISTLYTGLVAAWNLNDNSATQEEPIHNYDGTVVSPATYYQTSAKLGRCVTLGGALVSVLQ